MALKYKWLMEQIKKLIELDMKKGIDKLPTEYELCQMYQVSRQTTRQALSLLEKEGVITKRHGSGTYITGLSPNSSENTITLLVCESKDYIYPNLIQGICNTLYQHGYSTQLFETNNRSYKEREILRNLIASPPRGLIVEGCKTALPNPNLELYARLKKKGVRILFLNNYYPALLPCLYMKDNNLQGSRMLVQYLTEKGHTAIGGFFHAEDLQGLERFQGFLEEMYHQKLMVPDHRIAWFRSLDLERLRQSNDTQFIKKAVQECFRSCTAIICYNDEIAYWLIKCLQQMHYNIPQDKSIVSFDNSYFCNSESLPITSATHAPNEVGIQAALSMIDLLKGLPMVSKELTWKLVERYSSAAITD